MSTKIEEKLRALGYTLPTIPPSKGIYKKCVQVGNQLYVSGHVSVNTDGSFLTGKLGSAVSDEEGRIAARQAGLAILVSLKEHLGSLDKIKRVIKILGMVNSEPLYTNQPVIINGCSELYAQLWGEENGIGVRSAVGMGSLPGNVSVEIEAIFEI
jgi:enamine deaminase RidA (YjgF/YER057c/UK114 family)